MHLQISVANCSGAQLPSQAPYNTAPETQRFPFPTPSSPVLADNYQIALFALEILYFTSIKMFCRPSNAASAFRKVRQAQSSRYFIAPVARQTRNEKIEEDEVHVAEYSSDTDAGKPHHTVVKVDKKKTIAPQVVDIAKRAYALESGLIHKLSPTLSKFTLDGKVALITGYLFLRAKPKSPPWLILRP